MIQVVPAEEPEAFDSDVRQPGVTFLNGLLAGEEIDFSGREYWRKCLLALHDAYHSICAYTCHWIPLDTGADTVEHFRAKSTHPAQAYEWSNFRLVCGRLNGRKGTFTDVVDPFLIANGMFAIHFPSLQIIPGPNATAQQSALVESSVRRLKLNDERCVRSRLAYVEAFRDGHISAAHLQSHAPFLSLEIARQNLADRLDEIMRSN